MSVSACHEWPDSLLGVDCNLCACDFADVAGGWLAFRQGLGFRLLGAELRVDWHVCHAANMAGTFT
jgi:hypothetical protein